MKYVHNDGGTRRDNDMLPRDGATGLWGKRPLRPKYVGMGDWAQSPGLDETAGSSTKKQPALFQFDSTWTIRYHRMVDMGENANLYLSLRYTKVEQLVRRYAGLSVSIRSTHQAWMHIPPEHRLQVWQDVMLWCLHNNPTRALKLLLASMRGHQLRPPRYVVGDCLQQLAGRFLLKVANPDPWALSSIYHLVHKYAEGASEGQRVQTIPDQVVFLMLKHCDDKQVSSLLQRFTQGNVQLHANTLLQALARSMDMGNVNSALRLLRLVSKSGFSMDRDQVQKACVRLVRAQYNVPEPFAIQTKILTQILEMGIRPNIWLLNAILLNTVKAGYFDLALQIFEIAKVNNLRPDNITCNILLKGAVLNADRAERRRLVRELENDAELIRDFRLLGDLLHTISKTEEPAYPAMLALYKNHCDLKPLQELGLSEIEDHFKKDYAVPVKDIWPSADILRQMLCAYIQTHKDSDTLIDDYHRFHNLVLQDHPLITPVARSDHVANAFLMAFGHRAKTLPHCALVLKHMLDDSSFERLSVQSEESYPRLAAPSVRTWSILASAYSWHGQDRAAEKVLDLMRERGIKPDRITWNTIISGYSSLQKVEEAVDAMKRMEAAGFRPNDRTFKGLSKIYNRKRLLGVLGRTLGDDNAFKMKKWAMSEEELEDSRQEVETMAQGWETSSTVRDDEIYGYLQKRYENLAAEQKRRENAIRGIH